MAAGQERCRARGGAALAIASGGDSGSGGMSSPRHRVLVVQARRWGLGGGAFVRRLVAVTVARVAVALLAALVGIASAQTGGSPGGYAIGGVGGTWRCPWSPPISLVDTILAATVLPCQMGCPDGYRTTASCGCAPTRVRCIPRRRQILAGLRRSPTCRRGGGGTWRRPWCPPKSLVDTILAATVLPCQMGCPDGYALAA